MALARRAVVARERTFAHTIEGYVDLAAEQKNRVVATVRVARPLDADQRRRLQAALARQVGREVVLQEVIDPDVLGGVRVELGDEVIEGTVAGRLDEARRLFGAGRRSGTTRARTQYLSTTRQTRAGSRRWQN